MQPACGVERSDRIGQPAKQPDEPVIGEAAVAPGQDCLEITAVEPFQDDERAARVAATVLQANDPGVVESREEFRFARESLAPWGKLDEHPLAGRAVDRLKAARRAALASRQSIAIGQERAG